MEGDIATKKMDHAIQMEELASKERIEFAKMANVREIEMMKIGALSADELTAMAADREAVAAGKPSATEQLMQQMMALMEMIGRAQTMPKKITVDPFTGEKGVTVDPHFGTDRSRVQ